MKHVERLGSRCPRTGKRCRAIGQGQVDLLANLIQAVSVSGRVNRCRILTENRVTQWCDARGSRGQTRTRGTDAPEGSRRVSLLGCVALLGRCYSHLERERGPVTTTGRCAEHKSVDPSMLPRTGTRDWGLRDRLRVVYYHLWAAGAFPTPSQCFERTMLFRQVKISCYATNGNERKQGGRGHKRPGKKREPGWWPGQGIPLGTGMEKWEETSGKGKVV